MDIPFQTVAAVVPVHVFLDSLSGVSVLDIVVLVVPKVVVVADLSFFPIKRIIIWWSPSVS